MELTVYLRTAHIDVRAEDPCLVVLRSRTAAEGFHQEDGEVWSPDGRLLATSRQLAIMFVRDEIA
jgi:acyl-CoA thioesterase